MECREADAALVDLLYDELADDDRSRLLTHLEGCRACGDRWRRLTELAAAADRRPAPLPPRGIAERALVRVASERLREAACGRQDLAWSQAVGRVCLGAAAALVSLLLVTGALGRSPALTIGAAAVVWTVIYAGVLLPRSHPRLRGLAELALAGAGLALILTPPLSIPAVIEVCERWARSAQSSAPFALVLLVAAGGYTAGPLILGGLVLGRGAHDRTGVVDGLKLSLLYGLLVAPAVYLQCLSLPLATTALWMSGAVLGAAVAGPASLGLTRPRNRPA